MLWAAAGGSEGFFLYLVSNRHVLAHDASLTYKLQLHGRSGSETGFRLENNQKGLWIDLKNPDEVEVSTLDKYFAPPDKKIDLACIDCTHLMQRTEIVIIPFSQRRILDWSASVLFPTQQVVFVGYPDGVRDISHNLPVVRTGTIATHPHLDFDSEPDFLIDAHIWPGSSGSPIFVKDDVTDSFSLIGVLHTSRINDNEDGIGLGYAVRSSEVLKLCEAASKGKT